MVIPNSTANNNINNISCPLSPNKIIIGQLRGGEIRAVLTDAGRLLHVKRDVIFLIIRRLTGRNYKMKI